MSYFNISDNAIDIRKKIDNANDVDKLKALANKQLDIMVKMEELVEVHHQRLSLNEAKADGVEKIARGLLELLEKLNDSLLSSIDGIDLQKVITSAQEVLDF
jgi:ribosome-binding ATPase YchF (GTP1/OBG family)